MPSASARVRTTAIVCGNVSSSTMNLGPSPLVARRASCMASAAAVDSSSSEAPATSRPVRSVIIVWKFSSASSRPWEISGWYGVYAVYQAGFSRTLRWITPGMTDGWYPRPIIDGTRRLRLPRRRSSASTSGSLTAGGRSSPLSRITAGTVAAVRASRLA